MNTEINIKFLALDPLSSKQKEDIKFMVAEFENKILEYGDEIKVGMLGTKLFKLFKKVK